jgi:hypothetical protein
MTPSLLILQVIGDQSSPKTFVGSSKIPQLIRTNQVQVINLFLGHGFVLAVAFSSNMIIPFSTEKAKRKY